MDTPQVTDPLRPSHKGGVSGCVPPDSSCLSVCRAHPLRSCCLSFVHSRSFSTCLCRFRLPPAPTCHEPCRGNRRLILKFVWIPRGPKISKTLKKKNKVGRLRPPDFGTVWWWQRERHRDSMGQSPKRGPHEYGRQSSLERQREFLGEKKKSFQQMRP